MVYIPRKDLVKDVEHQIHLAKLEVAKSPVDEALIDAIEALLELVENDFRK